MSPSQWCLCTNAFSRALTFTGQIYKEIIAVRVRFLHRGFVRYLCQVTPFCLCLGGLCVERFLRTVFSTTQESIFQYYNSKFSWWWTCAELEIIIIIMEGNTTVTRDATTQMGGAMDKGRGYVEGRYWPHLQLSNERTLCWGGMPIMSDTNAQAPQLSLNIPVTNKERDWSGHGDFHKCLFERSCVWENILQFCRDTSLSSTQCKTFWEKTSLWTRAGKCYKNRW